MRNRSMNGGASNQFVADDTPGELQAQVTSDQANSRLVVGYNTRIVPGEGRKQARGIGWELATDSWGVLRANHGMLVTTETRSGAQSPAKDMGETVQRLTQAREQHEDMAQLAQRHNAQSPEASQHDVAQAIKAQNDAIRGGEVRPRENPFPEMTRPDLVLASAAGIGMSATQGTHIVSGQDHAVTAGRDVSVSSGRSLFASVRGAISMFAYQLGLKLIAAKGKVDIQAQSDQMTLAALKDITVTSTDGRVVITASKEVWIGAGGSYIQINGSGIINGSPGMILEKGASWDVPGPASMRMPLPDLPGEKSFSAQFVLQDRSGAVLRNYPYRLDAENGPTWYGITDENGLTQRVWTASEQSLRAHPHEAPQPDEAAPEDDPHDC
jgi:type VI secretion system secreted protein VgrG